MSPQTLDSDPVNRTAEDPRPRRRSWIWWSVGAIVLILALVIVVRYRSGATPSAAGRFAMGGPLAVGIARVATSDVPITVNALGTVTPLATVTVRPQVSGPLLKLFFTEGQLVKAGALLAQIDPRPYQAALDQAQGQLQRDQATLANAKVDLDRYQMLLSQNSVSEQQYATQRATVSQDEATVAADQATVEAAQLNLGYCRITSAVSGRVGLRQVDIGNLVQANSSSIVVVTQMQPISVLFTVPEDNVSEILQRLNHGEHLPIDAYDRSLTNKITTGTLANADNQIDTTTGTLKLRAMYDNARFELFPNQFVNVRLTLQTLHEQIVVPGAALQIGSSGSFVYVVNTATSTVAMRSVTTGPSNGDQVSIMQGLQRGETVVVDGADQLRDGARVLLPGAKPISLNAADSTQGSGSTHGTGAFAHLSPEARAQLRERLLNATPEQRQQLLQQLRQGNTAPGQQPPGGGNGQTPP